MVTACCWAILQTVVVTTTLRGLPCQIDYMKGPEGYGPVTITLFDKNGVQTDQICPYEGFSGFANNQILNGGKLNQPDYLIIRNDDMSPWYCFVAAGENGKIVHDEWASRGEFFRKEGGGFQSVIERVDLKRMRELGIRMEIPDGSERDYDSKKYMTVTHSYKDRKHGREYTFE
jgi:hypothetical protein